VATCTLLLATAGVSQAACYWQYPTSGYDGHVHYYNCRNMQNYNWQYKIAECWADWDSYAEWFWGKHDGPVNVVFGRTCYA
jgi:hypothetical protein